MSRDLYDNNLLRNTAIHYSGFYEDFRVGSPARSEGTARRKSKHERSVSPGARSERGHHSRDRIDHQNRHDRVGITRSDGGRLIHKTGHEIHQRQRDNTRNIPVGDVLSGKGMRNAPATRPDDNARYRYEDTSNVRPGDLFRVTTSKLKHSGTLSREDGGIGKTKQNSTGPNSDNHAQDRDQDGDLRKVDNSGHHHNRKRNKSIESDKSQKHAPKMDSYKQRMVNDQISGNLSVSDSVYKAINSKLKEANANRILRSLSKECEITSDKMHSMSDNDDVRSEDERVARGARTNSINGGDGKVHELALELENECLMTEKSAENKEVDQELLKKWLIKERKKELGKLRGVFEIDGCAEMVKLEDDVKRGGKQVMHDELGLSHSANHQPASPLPTLNSASHSSTTQMPAHTDISGPIQSRTTHNRAPIHRPAIHIQASTHHSALIHSQATNSPVPMHSPAPTHSIAPTHSLAPTHNPAPTHSPASIHNQSTYSPIPTRSVTPTHGPAAIHSQATHSPATIHSQATYSPASTTFSAKSPHSTISSLPCSTDVSVVMLQPQLERLKQTNRHLKHKYNKKKVSSTDGPSPTEPFKSDDYEVQLGQIVRDSKEVMKRDLEILKSANEELVRSMSISLEDLLSGEEKSNIDSVLNSSKHDATFTIEEVAEETNPKERIQKHRRPINVADGTVHEETARNIVTEVVEQTTQLQETSGQNDHRRSQRPNMNEPMDAKVRGLKRRNEELVNIARQLEEKVKNLQQDNHRIRRLSMNLERRKEELASVVRQLEDKVKNLEQDNPRETRHISGDLPVNSEHLNRLFARQRAKDLADYSRNLLLKDDEIALLHNKCRDLAEQINVTEATVPQNSHVYGEKEELINVIKQSAKERLLLESQVSRLQPCQHQATSDESTKQLRLELRDAQDSCEEVKRRESEIRSELREVQTQRDTIRTELVDARTERDVIRTQLVDTQTQRDSIQKDAIELEARTDALQKALDEEQKRVAELQEEHQTLSEQLQHNDDKNHKLCEEKDQELAESKRQLQQLRDELTDLQQQRVSTQSTKCNVIISTGSQTDSLSHHEDNNSCQSQPLDRVTPDCGCDPRALSEVPVTLAEHPPISTNEETSFGTASGTPLTNGCVQGKKAVMCDPERFSTPLQTVCGRQQIQVYIAKYSYDPQQYSPNDQPDAELPLKAGEYIIVVGDMDEDGFFCGELLNGHKGLVPSNFIEKVSDEDLSLFYNSTLIGNQDTNVTVTDDVAATDVTVTDDTDNIQPNKGPETPDSGAMDVADNTWTLTLSDSSTWSDTSNLHKKGIPFPTKLKLERLLTNSALVSWAAPENAKISQIQAYHVYRDNVFHTSVHANERTKALVEGVDSQKIHRVSVRAVSGKGQSDLARCTLLIGQGATAEPSNLVISNVTPTAATLKWLPGDSNCHHVIYLNGLEYSVLKPGVCKHMIVGLIPNTHYALVLQTRPNIESIADSVVTNSCRHLSASMNFTTLAAGLPMAPLDVQVEAGPQLGTLLLMWIPVTIGFSSTSNGTVITGYAIYADDVKVNTVTGATNDHMILARSELHGAVPSVITVKTIGENGIESLPSDPVHLSPDLIMEITGDVSKDYAKVSRVQQSQVTTAQDNGVKSLDEQQPPTLDAVIASNVADDSSNSELSDIQEEEEDDEDVDGSSKNNISHPFTSPQPAVRNSKSSQALDKDIKKSVSVGSQQQKLPIVPAIEITQESSSERDSSFDKQDIDTSLTMYSDKPSDGSINQTNGRPSSSDSDNNYNHTGSITQSPLNQNVRSTWHIRNTRSDAIGAYDSTLHDTHSHPQDGRDSVPSVIDTSTKKNVSNVKDSPKSRNISNHRDRLHENKDSNAVERLRSDNNDAYNDSDEMSTYIHHKADYDSTDSNGLNESPHRKFELRKSKNLSESKKPVSPSANILNSPVSRMSNGEQLDYSTDSIQELMSNNIFTKNHIRDDIPESELIDYEDNGEGDSMTEGPDYADTRPAPRLFIALFDYDPLSMSPNIETADEELPFKEGQIIKVYGDKDNDGFFHGQYGTLSGYVPCNMVSEVQVDDPDVAAQLLDESMSHHNHSKRHVTSQDSLVSPSSNPSIPTNISTRVPTNNGSYGTQPRKMVALYDYDPKELSPNVDSELELIFKKGQYINVYGEMDEDGFFMGELSGNSGAGAGSRGLVPSNFLHELSPVPSDDEISSLETPSPIPPVISQQYSPIQMEPVTNLDTTSPLDDKKTKKKGLFAKGKNIFKKLTR